MLAIRLKDGEDLKKGICDFAVSKGITSYGIVGATGSLKNARIRMAGATPDNQDVREYDGPLEIVSLSGTIDKDGQAHIHISVSDKEGKVTGGHLKEGSVVHTTSEVVLVSDPSLIFSRNIDESTGFDELTIEEVK